MDLPTPETTATENFVFAETAEKKIGANWLSQISCKPYYHEHSSPEKES